MTVARAQRGAKWLFLLTVLLVGALFGIALGRPSPPVSPTFQGQEEPPPNAYVRTYGGSGHITVRYGFPDVPPDTSGYTEDAYGFGVSTIQDDFDCEGTVEATFIWTGPDQPPPYAVITETCVAYAWTTAGTASYDNDLGTGSGLDPVTGTPIPKYTIKSNPGWSFKTVTRSPSASGMGALVHVNVRYTATASPVSLGLSGTLVDAGVHNLLIGQGITASVHTGYTITGNVTWSIPGQTFAGFSVNEQDPQSGTVLIFTPGNGMSAHWYWKSGGTYTVSASVALSAGGQSIGTVNLSRDVIVHEPTFAMQTTAPTDPVFDPQDPASTMTLGICFASSWVGNRNLFPDSMWVHAGNQDLNLSGIKCRGWVETPALFSGRQGNGGWIFAQLADLERRIYNLDGYRYIRATGTVASNGIVTPDYWLDTTWGYEPVLTRTDPWVADGTEPFYDSPYYPMSDSPGQQVFVNSDMQYSLNDDFEVYQLYRPPGPDSTWVPLHLSTWEWHATESAPYGTAFPYAISGSAIQVLLDTNTTIHPEWSNLIALPHHPSVVIR